jgi:fumarate hydratase subunit alpha
LLDKIPSTSSQKKIKKSIVEKILEAGPDACPPFYQGVSVGGTFESAPRNPRNALFRLLRGDAFTSEEEDFASSLLEELNKSGLGPMGVGGKSTALGLAATLMPTHIASLPVAINLCCHSFRSAYFEI